MPIESWREFFVWTTKKQ